MAEEKTKRKTSDRTNKKEGDCTNGFTARLAQKSEMVGGVSVDGNPSVSEYSKRCSRGGYGVLRYVS